MAAGTNQERRGRRRREARSAARARPRAEGCGRRPPRGAWRALPSCADSRCRSAPRADGACREKQPVPGPRRETQPRGTTRLVTPETGRDRGRRGHVVRTRALAERASTGRARTGAAEQREAAERVREGARHGASEHDAAASPARRRAPGGAEASCGGPGSDEVSGQPGAASPWGRPRVPDPRPGPGFRGLRRAGRGEIGGVSGPTRGWRAVQTADRRGPSQGRREAGGVANGIGHVARCCCPGKTRGKLCSRAQQTAIGAQDIDAGSPGSRGGQLRAPPPPREGHGQNGPS